MTNLRRNHQQSAVGGGTAVKVGIFAAIIGGLFWGFNQFLSGDQPSEDDRTEVVTTEKPNRPKDSGPSEPDFETMPSEFLPTSTTGQIVEHTYFALSYNEEHEQAEWVAFELYKQRLYPPFVERTNNFRPDPKVRKASASDRDYRNTGYDRGHLAAAADMSFNEKAMSESFYMSNMSPQIHNFNTGIWRELEENTRYWAKKNEHLYVITGPVLTAPIREKIGLNEVSVPELFYKILLDYTAPEGKAIAFLIPNELSNKPLSEYVTTIDEIEELTGIDFFADLMDEETEKEMESASDINLWPLSDKKYQLRVKKWNKQK